MPVRRPRTARALFGQDSAYTINDAFNLAWNTYNGTGGHGNLQPNIERFIDLRVTSNIDGTYGPLFPDSNVNINGVHVVIAGNDGSFNRAAIVPGSDQIWGPDQNPGPNYGNEIRYTRTTQQPGPNQYRINYVHQPEPANYATLGLSASDLAGFNPAVYDPTNFVSATIQARYMPGIHRRTQFRPRCAARHDRDLNTSQRKFPFHSEFTIGSNSRDRSIPTRLTTIRAR